MAGAEWGTDGELPDFGPGKVEPTRAYPVYGTPKGDKLDPYNEPYDDGGDGPDDGPSFSDIFNAMLLALAIAAAIAAAAGAGQHSNSTPTSSPSTPPTSPPDTPSPAPTPPGTPTPAQPAPATPKPDPVPHPTPKPDPAPGTSHPPAKCWVAREVYGYNNPSWLLFRDYLDFSSPTWFKKFYISHGEKIADFIKDKPFLKNLIRAWMDTKI